jgi:hypothetical protein
MELPVPIYLFMDMFRDLDLKTMPIQYNRANRSLQPSISTKNISVAINP